MRVGQLDEDRERAPSCRGRIVMAKVRLTINKCVQDSQQYGSDDDFMISRMFFSVQSPSGQRFDGYVNLKQVVGSGSDEGAIEVSAPLEYSGPSFNHQVFTKEVTACFQDLVGRNASAIRLGSGTKNVRMRNNTFVLNHSFDIDTA